MYRPHLQSTPGALMILLSLSIIVISSGPVDSESPPNINPNAQLSQADWDELHSFGCKSHDEMIARLKQVNFKAKNDQKWCMIFYHIPKTAGTTLRSLWNNNRLNTYTYGYDFWRKQTVVDRRFLEAIRHGTEFQNQFKIMQGHFGYGMKTLMKGISAFVNRNRIEKKSTAVRVPGVHSEKLPPIGQECFEGTMLREPVARVISAFFFHKQFNHRNISDPDAWDDCLGRKNFSAMYRNGTNFQDNPDGLCFEYSNDHVKWLSGKFTMRMHRVIANNKTTFGTNGHATEQHLILAKQNLCKMDFLLMQGDMDQSMKSTAQTLGLKLKVQNFTWDKGARARKAKPGEITEEIMGIIRKYNALDSDLHRFAVKLYSAWQTAYRHADIPPVLPRKKAKKSGAKFGEQ